MQSRKLQFIVKGRLRLAVFVNRHLIECISVSLFAALILVVLSGCSGGGGGTSGPSVPGLSTTAREAGTLADPAIAFKATKSMGAELMVMNSDGSNQSRVLEAGNINRPRWSPDGKQLSFGSDVQGNGIYTINVDGTGLRKVTSLNLAASAWAGYAWSPVPAPDGKFKIATRDGNAPKGDLFLVNVDGTGRTQLTNTPDLDELDPTWSPTATRIAAQVGTSMGSRIFVYDLTLDSDGRVAIGSVTDVTSAGPLSSGGNIAEPAWAKAHDRIAVTATQDIWMIDLLNPASPLNLTATSGLIESFSSWSPDDSRIVFARPGNKKRQSIFIMNADGSGLTSIAEPAGRYSSFAQPDWRRNP